MDLFFIYLELDKGYSKNTCEAYGSDLRYWSKYVENHNINWREAQSQDIYSFLFELSQKKNISKRSQSRVLSSLKSFYRYCEKESLVDKNMLRNLRSPKHRRGLPHPIKSFEIGMILESNTKQSIHLQLRDKALWELMYSAGLRISEILSLDIKDVIESYSNVESPEVLDSFKVLGKGGKERIVFIGSYAKKSIQNYLYLRSHKQKNDQRKSLERKEALFINGRGERLSRRGAQYILKERLKKLGIFGNYSPHSFRHAFATDLLNQGAELRHIQEMLGHSSISTTQNYTHVAIQKIKDTFYKSHPHANRNRLDFISKEKIHSER